MLNILGSLPLIGSVNGKDMNQTALITGMGKNNRAN